MGVGEPLRHTNGGSSSWPIRGTGVDKSLDEMYSNMSPKVTSTNKGYGNQLDGHSVADDFGKT